jgi:hypothetical protein
MFISLLTYEERYSKTKHESLASWCVGLRYMQNVRPHVQINKNKTGISLRLGYFM